MATIPAWGLAFAWSMGWIGTVSLVGPERGTRCDGALLPAGPAFTVVMVWALPVVFGIATGAVLLLLRRECGDAWRGRQGWLSPALLAAVLVLPVLGWMQQMATQRAVGELVALFPHSRVCGG